MFALELKRVRYVCIWGKLCPHLPPRPLTPCAALSGAVPVYEALQTAACRISAELVLRASDLSRPQALLDASRWARREARAVAAHLPKQCRQHAVHAARVPPRAQSTDIPLTRAQPTPCTYTSHPTMATLLTDCRVELWGSQFFSQASLKATLRARARARWRNSPSLCVFYVMLETMGRSLREIQDPTGSVGTGPGLATRA